MAVDLAQVIPPLVHAKLDFILIGGMAAILHGSARVTFDVDVVYSRTHDNIERLTTALAPHRPYDLGDIDLLGEVAAGETYQTLLPHSFEVEAFSTRFKCLDLPTLIRIKEAAGRPKDREAIAELRVLLEESQKREI
jgi:predicted nucleotidyltransferase